MCVMFFFFMFARTQIPFVNGLSQVLRWLANGDEPCFTFSRLRHNGDVEFRRAWTMVIGWVLFHIRSDCMAHPLN